MIEVVPGFAGDISEIFEINYTWVLSFDVSPNKRLHKAGIRVARNMEMKARGAGHTTPVGHSVPWIQTVWA